MTEDRSDKTHSPGDNTLAGYYATLAILIEKITDEVIVQCDLKNKMETCTKLLNKYKHDRREIEAAIRKLKARKPK